MASKLLSVGVMSATWLWAALGGVMIGAASAFLLLAHGRIAGVSGIVGGLGTAGTTDRSWRLAFLGGLAAAGIAAAIAAPDAVGGPVRHPLVAVIAGMLVGIGTSLGNGCTSGHGVCGLARGSVRSLAAVVVFMTTGAVTATLAGYLS